MNENQIFLNYAEKNFFQTVFNFQISGLISILNFIFSNKLTNLKTDLGRIVILYFYIIF